VRYDFPPALIEVMQRQLAQFGRVGAVSIYRTPPVAAILAGQDSVPVPIQFRQEPGIVLAAYGQVESGATADYAGTEVRVQIGGSEDLFTDGASGQFAPMLMLFPPTNPWFAINRPARPGIDWQVTFRNRTGVAVTPVFALAFVPQSALAR
jgi:hypothetical protein